MGWQGSAGLNYGISQTFKIDGTVNIDAEKYNHRADITTYTYRAGLFNRAGLFKKERGFLKTGPMQRVRL